LKAVAKRGVELDIDLSTRVRSDRLRPEAGHVFLGLDLRGPFVAGSQVLHSGVMLLERLGVLVFCSMA